MKKQPVRARKKKGPAAADPALVRSIAQLVRNSFEARARRVTVRLGEHQTFEIRDDGQGFDAASRHRVAKVAHTVVSDRSKWVNGRTDQGLFSFLGHAEHCVITTRPPGSKSFYSLALARPSVGPVAPAEWGSGQNRDTLPMGGTTVAWWTPDQTPPNAKALFIALREALLPVFVGSLTVIGPGEMIYY